jgi:hypothetical protein
MSEDPAQYGNEKTDQEILESMNPVTVASKINERISEIDFFKDQIFEASLKKAETKREFAKACAITKFKLMNGVIETWEGQAVGKKSQSAAGDLAEDMNYQLQFDYDVAEGNYKSIIVAIAATQAQLNGLQSINRHLQNES